MRTRWIDPLVLLGLAGTSIWEGIRIVRTAQDTVGSTAAGGWLVLIGALLAGCVGIYAFGQLRTRSGREVGWRSGDGVHPVLIVAAMLMAFVFLLPKLGYVTCTALFFAVYLLIFGHYNWVSVLLGAAAFAAGSGYLWASMGMMLPQGALPWP